MPRQDDGVTETSVPEQVCTVVESLDDLDSFVFPEVRLSRLLQEVLPVSRNALCQRAGPRRLGGSHGVCSKISLRAG